MTRYLLAAVLLCLSFATLAGVRPDGLVVVYPWERPEWVPQVAPYMGPTNPQTVAPPVTCAPLPVSFPKALAKFVGEVLQIGHTGRFVAVANDCYRFDYWHEVYSASANGREQGLAEVIVFMPDDSALEGSYKLPINALGQQIAASEITTDLYDAHRVKKGELTIRSSGRGCSALYFRVTVNNVQVFPQAPGAYAEALRYRGTPYLGCS